MMYLLFLRCLQQLGDPRFGLWFIRESVHDLHAKLVILRRPCIARSRARLSERIVLNRRKQIHHTRSLPRSNAKDGRSRRTNEPPILKSPSQTD